MKPKITIIMPSLNVAQYIEECMESVLNQTLKELEIICIDAGSRDGTYEILQNYAEQDKRIRLIQSDKKSYGYQINLGMKLARTEYIGIVETDDYIDSQMYEKLAEIIEEERADYVKADFDLFRVLKSGKRIFSENKSLNTNELYNKKICPSYFLDILTGDQSIWKGIYRKSFLEINQIKLSETSSAAYQDIGFVLQTIAMAKQAVYIPESYYRYRIEREGASSCSLKSLNNCCYEYKRLYPLIKSLYKNGNDIVIEGYYTRMCLSFIGEYKKILIAEDFCTDSKYLAESYGWFSEQLHHAIKNGYLTKNKVIETIWDELLEILEDENGFACKLHKQLCRKKANDKVLIERMAGKEVIVFGIGTWGKEAFIWLDQSDIDVVAFCDNNEKLWGQVVADIPIHSLEQNRKEHPSAYYLIANKRCAEKIQQQLTDAGINKEQIVKYLR